jgi:hypothetical protein
LAEHWSPFLNVPTERAHRAAKFVSVAEPGKVPTRQDVVPEHCGVPFLAGGAVVQHVSTQKLDTEEQRPERQAPPASHACPPLPLRVPVKDRSASTVEGTQ